MTDSGEYFDEVIYPELMHDEWEAEIEEYQIARKWADKIRDGRKCGSELVKMMDGE